MSASVEWIAALEWANYEANLPVTRVTPDLELTLAENVIITSSETFPIPDTTHACRLRTTPQAADNLIEEVTGYFTGRELPPTIYLSPACSPPDLPERLQQQGYSRQVKEEAWLTLDVPTFEIPPGNPAVTVSTVTKADVLTFCQVFMTAFAMPVDFAPLMARLIGPSVAVDSVYHYLAWAGQEPVGVCSLVCHRPFGVLGSVGVLDAYRGQRVATNLVGEAIRTALANGVDTLMLQTVADAPLERFLRLSGFERTFTRGCYVLR